MPYIIGLNGPARAGKTTIACILQDLLEARTTLPVIAKPISLPLRKATAALLGINYTESWWEAEKDIDDFDGLGGDTPREFAAQLSKDFLWPTYGQNFLIHTAMAHLPESCFLILPDVGYKAELTTIQQKAGRGNSIFINISREALKPRHDFREKLYHPETITFQNNGPAGTLDRQIEDEILSKIQDKGWIE